MTLSHPDDSTGYLAAQELFLELLDASASERESALARRASTDPALARQVASMLSNDPGTSLDDGRESRRFGPYEVVRTIARGGMGEVVVAKRIDGEFEREVAIKLMRGDFASKALMKRFLRERQTLARLDHEYIARLLDGGTTEDGEPYLVMEFVDGVPADAFATGLDLRERLELFVRICEAVEHAHDQGVVHRDLKPSNILVRPDGRPRLLDFGIARHDEAVGVEGEPLTRTGHRLFTPEYASPEQIRGETVTPKTDQFALGVLLYVLISGRSPWDKARDLHELESWITSVDPPPPSRRLSGTARRRLPRDLDAIVMQCLEKRPVRRYPSVSDLRMDIELHLEGRPVKARRSHTLERAGRFVVRNPLIPVVAALLFIAGVAAIAAFRAESQGEARRQELIASAQDRVKTAQEHWFAGFLDDADKELDAALTAARQLENESGLRGEILAQMAILAGVRKDWERALELVRDAELALEDSDEVDHEVVLQLLTTRANAHFHTSASPESASHSLAAMRYAREHLEPGHALRADAILGWSDELRRIGRADEAIALIEEVIEEVREKNPNHRVLGRFLNHRAVALAENGRVEEAIEEYRNVLTAISWHHGDGHPAFGSVRLNLASALFRIGRWREAEPEYEASLANCRLHEKEALVAANAHFLARVKLLGNELDRAREYAEEAIALRVEQGNELHAERSRVVLALIDDADGREAEARATLEPLLRASEEPLQEGRLLKDVEADARRAYGQMLIRAGKHDEGRAQLELALLCCEAAPWVDVELRTEIRALLATDSESR